MSLLIGWLASLLLHATWIATVAALAVWVLLRWARDPRIAHGVAAGGLLLIAAALLTLGIATWPRTPQRIAVAAPVAVTTAPQPIQLAQVAPRGSVLVAAPAGGSMVAQGNALGFGGSMMGAQKGRPNTMNEAIGVCTTSAIEGRPFRARFVS